MNPLGLILLLIAILFLLVQCDALFAG